MRRVGELASRSRSGSRRCSDDRAGARSASTRPRRRSWSAPARPRALELVEAAIARIEALNPALNAVIHALFDEAREAAAGELPDGPFRGVPFLLKDLGAAFAGQPLHLGMQLLKEAGFRAPVDSYLAQRFRDAGLRHDRQDQHSRARDPADHRAAAPTGRPAIPGTASAATGGSSGGSAAAVAAGMVADRPRQRRWRLDPDPGRALRAGRAQADPASGSPRGPLIGDVMSGLTAELAVSRSVRDAARVLDAVGGPAPGDPYVAPPPARPYADELDARPRRAADRLRRGAARCRSSSRTPTASPRSRAARELLESLGHGSRTPRRSILRLAEALRPRGHLPDPVGGRPGGQPRPDLGPARPRADRRRRRAADLGAGGDRPGALGRTLPARRRHAPGGRARDRRLARGRLRPAAHPDDGRAAAAARHASTTPGPIRCEAIRRAIPSGAFTALFNATGQPAISLPLHWSAGRAADRGPARRPVRRARTC